MNPIVGALLVSIIAFALLCVIDTGPKRTRYWRRFARRTYWPAQSGLLFIYGLVGAGGWFLNQNYVQHPPDGRWLLNGLIAVGIGQAILRFDISALNIDGRDTARSLLVGSQQWLLDDLDESAQNGVIHAVRALPDDQLEQLALDIAQLFITRDPKVPDPAKVEVLGTLTEAGMELRSGSHNNGRSRLVDFCTATVTEQRLTFHF